MRIIVAIDILEGKCVRLTRGDYDSRKIYNSDPLEAAMEISDNGLKFLHLVDLDGARNKRITNYNILEKIAVKTGLSIDFGGGIRTDDDLRIAFLSGAGQVTCGSVAVNSPELFLGWLKNYGPDKIILGADFRDRKVVTEGWSEQSQTDIIKFISGFEEKGLKYCICTDADKDGMLEGPATDLYREILKSSGIKLIASGGISSMKDIGDLRDSGCEGAILGKAVYERRVKLKDLGKIC